jgi:hypothetical protein
MIVAVSGMDSLGERAAKMREALQKSQTITDNVVTILGSFDSRLSVLETAMRPTQVSRCGIFFCLVEFCLVLEKMMEKIGTLGFFWWQTEEPI